MAMVTTNGLTRSLAIRSPFTRPIAAPTRRPMTIAAGTPWAPSAWAAATLVNPMFAPTDRSNPPTVMANIWPIATTSRIPACRAMLRTLSVVG